MTNDNNPLTAVEVIRCVYLARVAAKRDDCQTARRWQAKAGAWLERTRIGPRDVDGTTATRSIAQ